MQLKIYHGTKQLARNIVEIATDTTKIIIDCGKDLPLLDENFSENNIEIDGLTTGSSIYDGIFITNYHADHTGLIENINPDIPIYMSETMRNVLHVVSDFIDAPIPRITRKLKHGREIRVGDINILPIFVSYFDEEVVLLLVQAEGKKLLYTDRFSYVDEVYLPLIGKVDVMLCDGINIGVHGGITEEDIGYKAYRIMKETEGLVFVLSSIPDTKCIRQVDHACRRSKRVIAYDLFTRAILNNIIRIRFTAKQMGFTANYPDEKKTRRIDRYLADGFQNFSEAEIIAEKTNLTILVRETMGEFLQRVDKLSRLENATLIYFMWRGYENTTPTKRFLDLCRSMGMRIEYLYTDDHAYREQLEAAVSQLLPDSLIPIHTESADYFRELHNNVCLLDEGELLKF